MRRLGTCEAGMDIACPNCDATYRVPDALINGVNALRCAACEQTWVPEPLTRSQMEEVTEEVKAVATEAVPPPPAPELPPPPPPPPEPEPEPAPAPPAPSPRPPPMRSDVTLSLTATRAGPPDLAPSRLPEAPRRQRSAQPALSLAWVLSIALVATILVALIVYRVHISAIWPPFARLAG